jgi:hypothetical protein
MADPDLVFCTDEASLNVSGYVISQNSRNWSAENPHSIHEVPLSDEKIGVRCAVCDWCAQGTIGTVFFHETINSERYFGLILTPSLRELTEEKTYGNFMQDNATARPASHATDEIECLVIVW